MTNHISRIHVPNQTVSGDADAEAIVAATWPDLMGAVDRTMSANPQSLVMAMAVSCFWDGLAASGELHGRLEARAGVPVVTPPEASAEALGRLGARRIVDFLPHMPQADRHVQRWFEDVELEVSEMLRLRAPQEDQVIDLGPEQIREALLSVDGPGVEAIVQVATSIAMARLARAAEWWVAQARARGARRLPREYREAPRHGWRGAFRVGPDQ